MTSFKRRRYSPALFESLRELSLLDTIGCRAGDSDIVLNSNIDSSNLEMDLSLSQSLYDLIRRTVNVPGNVKEKPWNSILQHLLVLDYN